MNEAPRQSPKVWIVRPKKCSSGCICTRAYSQVIKRVHNRAVDARLEVQVRSEAAAGAAGVADDLALGDVRADAGGEARLVRVPREERRGVLNAREVAVPAARGLGLHEPTRARGGGADRGAARH